MAFDNAKTELEQIKHKQAGRFRDLSLLVAEATGLMKDLTDMVVTYEFVQKLDHLIIYHSKEQGWCPARVVEFDRGTEWTRVEYCHSVQVSNYHIDRWWLQDLSTFVPVAIFSGDESKPRGMMDLIGSCSRFPSRQFHAFLQGLPTWRIFGMSHHEFLAAFGTFQPPEANRGPVPQSRGKDLL
jgi:hypothetical protein